MNTFLIQDKEFELKLTLEQLEIVKPLLADYDEWKFVMNSVSNFQVNPQNLQSLGMQLLNLMDKLVNDRKMLKLLSYILVEKGRDFSADEAIKNEIILCKIDFVQLNSLFGEFLKSCIAIDTLQQLNQLKDN